jgi:hypothetical protein
MAAVETKQVTGCDVIDWSRVMSNIRCSLMPICCTILLLLTTANLCAQQYLIQDGFEGDTLPSHWIQTAGNSSNYSVAGGQWNILNANGGLYDGGWTWSRFKTDFVAIDSFFVWMNLTYVRSEQRLFELRLYNNHNQSVVWFRIWDGAQQYILIGTTVQHEACYQEIVTAFTPTNLRIYRSGSTVSLGWDGSVQWQCTVGDTIQSIELGFAQLPDGNPVQMTIDSIYASSGEYCYVQQLLIDGQAATANLTNHSPVFSWSPTCSFSPTVQDCYEIEVGTNNDWTAAEMWDPDTFVSADTQVVYAGTALVDGTTYYARVRSKLNDSWTSWHATSFRMNTGKALYILLFDV